MEAAQGYLSTVVDGVDGDDRHAPFPGCGADRGFRTELRTDEATVELITRRESEDIRRLRRSRERFETLLSLLNSKLTLLRGRDHPLDYVVLALSDDLYRRCRTVDYVQEKVGQVHRDLRRCFKVLAMRSRLATQILLDSTTTAGEASTRRGGRQLDHPAVVAWNLFTGMYFKVEGLPWAPTGLSPGSCFIGVAFFRPLGSGTELRTSVVQAFDESIWLPGDRPMNTGREWA